MKYAPTILIVHPKHGIAKGLASVFHEYGFHALSSTDSVDALELVENLCFDVAVVSDEMPSALPEFLFQSNKENWLEVLGFHTPEDNVWDMGEFMLAVSEAAKERDWMCYWIAEAWHAAWYGEAGYETWPTETRQQPKPETYEELRARVHSLSEGLRAS
jgi:hypothetical protein